MQKHFSHCTTIWGKMVRYYMPLNDSEKKVIFSVYVFVMMQVIGYILLFVGVVEDSDDVFLERTRLYDSLVEFFPDNMTQPRANLTDMVSMH